MKKNASKPWRVNETENKKCYILDDTYVWAVESFLKRTQPPYSIICNILVNTLAVKLR